VERMFVFFGVALDNGKPGDLISVTRSEVIEIVWSGDRPIPPMNDVHCYIPLNDIDIPKCEDKKGAIIPLICGNSDFIDLETALSKTVSYRKRASPDDYVHRLVNLVRCHVDPEKAGKFLFSVQEFAVDNGIVGGSS